MYPPRPALPLLGIAAVLLGTGTTISLSSAGVITGANQHGPAGVQPAIIDAHMPAAPVLGAAATHTPIPVLDIMAGTAGTRDDGSDGQPDHDRPIELVLPSTFAFSSNPRAESHHRAGHDSNHDDADDDDEGDDDGAAAAALEQHQKAPVQFPGNTDPFGCTVPPMIIRKFTWFDSFHNLDCGGSGPDLGDGTICSSQLPGNENDPPGCVPVPICSTGVQSAFPNDSPPGYGPPDTMTVQVDGFGLCGTTSSGLPYTPIGTGLMNRCFETDDRIGRKRVGMTSDGSAIKDRALPDAPFQYRRNVHLTGVTTHTCTTGDGTVHTMDMTTVADFPVMCTHDPAHNATCVFVPTDRPVEMRVVQFG